MISSWTKAQAFETDWWGNCSNTYGEETKQYLYASRMGLSEVYGCSFNLGGKSVVDIGGGPVSLLLKCANGSMRTVIEPMTMPDWVYKRYEAAGIQVVQSPAEKVDVKERAYDEAWIYNVLQHTIDPKKVIEKAREMARLIRIFEWLNTTKNVGHPHSLNRADLDNWLGGKGKTEPLNGQNGCFGLAYYGVFPVEGEKK